MWIAAAAGALLVLVTGLLPLGAAGDILAHVAPVLVFLVGVTIVAELADSSGVFDVAAHRTAVWGRGRTLRLWLLLVALGTGITILLSLDTTAVLLTPVVILLVQRAGLPVLPFAMVTVWLANTASLLLPISNLTNLLAQQQLSASTLEYASHMWLPAVVAVMVTVLVLGLRYRRDLRGSYPVPDAPVVADHVLFRCSAAVCLAIGPLAIAGIPVMWISVAGALVLTLLFAARRRERLRLDLLPWRLVVLVVGLFFLVGSAQQHGLDQLLSDAVGQGSSWGSALRLAAVGGVGANLINNLPAYASLEPVAAGAGMLYPLLLAVNLGPLVLMWGSLATLLWRERCRSLGVDVPWREFALVGLVGVPLLLILTTAAEQLTR